MKLYASPTSPFARKCRVLIREKNGTSHVSEENIVAMQDPPALHEANPLGKVPALVLANGDTLFDSPLICEYLDSTLEGETMIPLAHPERWPVLRFQALADGIMDAAVAITMERGRKDSEQSKIWLGRWHRAIDRSLQILDDEVTKLDGPVDLSHIAVGSALGYLDFRHAALEWQKSYREIAGWWADMNKRPSFTDTAPPAS